MLYIESIWESARGLLIMHELSASEWRCFYLRRAEQHFVSSVSPLVLLSLLHPQIKDKALTCLLCHKIQLKP